MNGTRLRRHTSPYGRVTIQDLGKERLTSRREPGLVVSVHRSRYSWRPSRRVAAQLPRGFCLTLDCITASDGVRRFVPGKDTRAFILEASLGGSAVLACQRNLDPEHRFAYHAMRLLYQQAHRLREHFDRCFRREQDLYLPRAGRIGQDDGHVLPLVVGLDSTGKGNPWRPVHLIEHGRATAVEAGNDKADLAECIRLGLLEAARRNPLDPTALTELEARQLVRLALFDLGPALEPVEGPLCDQVIERLLGALQKHVDDDTPSFNRWFFDAVDNLVHQIAKKKRPGGPMPREVVRQALLESVFRAYTYVGDCLHVQMLAFRQALPQDLNEEELALFRAMYLKQPCLGGLPLLLLHDRFAFLREIVLESWDQPQDGQRLGTLLRMLHFHGEMVSKKREGDRRYKRQRGHRNEQGKSAQSLALDPDRDAAPESATNLFQDIAAHLRELRRASCRCPTTCHWRAQLQEEQTTGSVIVWTDACGECDHSELVRVTTEDFKGVGLKVMGIGDADET